MIDEPELCLHPPQAYHVGRFIGQYAKEDHVTVVATHSSHVLRGVLQTGKRVTVIRLTRRKKQFSGRLIAERELVDNLRNPRTRAEAILDGVFSKGVVLVESEGDREEYQAASEKTRGPLPKGARADLSIDGAIQIERLPNVMHVGRPAYGAAESTIRLFRVTPNKGEAERVNVDVGKASVNDIVIRRGLARGDSLIISDMSQLLTETRVRLK